MSDFHLQQLAAASASVPGNRNNAIQNSNVTTNSLTSQQPAGTAVMVPDAVPTAGATPAPRHTQAPSYSVFTFRSLPSPSVDACHSNVNVNVNVDEVAHGNGHGNVNDNTTPNARVTTGTSASASASADASASAHAVDGNTHMTMQQHTPHADAVHVHYPVHQSPQFQMQLQTQAIYHQQQLQQQQLQQQQPFNHHLQTQHHGNVHRSANDTVVHNNVPSIPPPHPVHAPHATNADHSQMGMPSYALRDPIHHHNDLTQPVIVTTNANTNTTHKPDSNAVNVTVIDVDTVNATHHGPLVMDAVNPSNIDDLYAKYRARCDECKSLRLSLNMKAARIRKLEKELSNMRAQMNSNNNNNIKASTNFQKDAHAPTPLSPTHDQGNSGDNTSLGLPPGDNNNINNNNNVVTNNYNNNNDDNDNNISSSITIDVDIGPSSSRTRSYDQRWKSRFQDLVKYKLTHGDCIVPKSYKDKGLHSWVRKQRILKKDFDLGLASEESMTQERVHALQSIGFAWVVGHQSNDGQWEANFQQLVVFKSQYGHTRVPQSYDKTLHKWVLNQRCRRRLLEDKGEGKAKGMTWTRIEKLDAIDFSWAGKK
jgi:hypothetical protein